MHLSTRQLKIIEVLSSQQEISVKALSDLLFFSESTIRRELAVLEHQQLIHRTHGGATIRHIWEEGIPVLIRETQKPEVKQLLSKAAASHVKDGDRIFIDSSSTVLDMVDFLSDKRDLTIITNGLQLADKLVHMPHIKTISTGGQLITTSYSFVGPQAERFLEYNYADKCFFSTSSFSFTEGVTDASEMEAAFKRKMVLHSKEIYYLADASKLNHYSTYQVCYASQVTMMITDDPSFSLPPSSGLGLKICHISEAESTDGVTSSF